MLDCSYTRLKELPEGMEQLSHLRVLNLSHTKQLQTFQAGVVSGLSGLEVLEMTYSNYKWGVQGKVEEGQATFDELESLKQLIRLCINLKSTTCPSFEYVPWIGRLKSFKFFVGSVTDTEEDKI